MKTILLSGILILSSVAVASVEDIKAKKFHKQFIEKKGKRVKIPAIQYQILSSDGNPVRHVMVRRFVSYKKRFSDYRPDIKHMPVNKTTISNKDGEVLYPKFKKRFSKKAKPEIRLELLMFYPVTQCAASISRMSCVEDGKISNSRVGEARVVKCTIPHTDDEIENCFE